MAEKKIPVFEYRKITREAIHDFMKDNATKEEMADFYDACIELVGDTMLVPDCHPGTDKQKMVRRKQKDGTYKVIPKMKRVAIPGSDTKETYNHRKAVAWFVDTYEKAGKIIVNGKPEKKADKKAKVSALSLFADFKRKEEE